MQGGLLSAGPFYRNSGDMMWPVDCIEAKRDGKVLPAEAIFRFINDYTCGRIADYQAAAWLMAVYLRGMNDAETAALTRAMAESGDTVDLSPVSGIKVDKHSTGGIADTTTLVVAPLVAAAGVKVAKMSGRGLGFTGGTIDKLESIPGFRTVLGKDEFFRQVNDLGIAVIGQSADLAPADKLLYALRDATGTIESIPLIAASIMSKKLAAGADAIILDVKYGDGAFMKTVEKAKELAQTMVRIGKTAGRPTTAVITSMNAPLGMAIGNSLEVDEAVAALSGRGGRRLMEVVPEIGAQMLMAAGKAASVTAGKTVLDRLVKNGAGLEKFRRFVAAQGGDTAWIGVRPLTRAEKTYTVRAEVSGYITAVKSEELGRIAMESGAGRAKKEDTIDYHVGIALHKELYDFVAAGEPLCTLYLKDNADGDASGRRCLACFETADELPPEREPVVAAVVTE